MIYIHVQCIKIQIYIGLYFKPLVSRLAFGFAPPAKNPAGAPDNGYSFQLDLGYAKPFRQPTIMGLVLSEDVIQPRAMGAKGKWLNPLWIRTIINIMFTIHLL